MQAITRKLDGSGTITSIDLELNKKGTVVVSAQVTNTIQYSIGYSVDILFVNTDTEELIDSVTLLHTIGSDVLMPYAFAVNVRKCSIRIRSSAGAHVRGKARGRARGQNMQRNICIALEKSPKKSAQGPASGARRSTHDRAPRGPGPVYGFILVQCRCTYTITAYAPQSCSSVLYF